MKNLFKLLILLLVSFSAHAQSRHTQKFEDPFYELKENNIEYFEMYSASDIRVYSVNRTSDKPRINFIVDTIRRARVCFPKYFFKKTKVVPNIDDKNPIDIVIVKNHHINGANRLFNPTILDGNFFAAITVCHKRNPYNRNYDKRNAMYFVDSDISTKFLVHEVFHIMACRVLNLELPLRIEEKYAQMFDSFDCKEGLEN